MDEEQAQNAEEMLNEIGFGIAERHMGTDNYNAVVAHNKAGAENMEQKAMTRRMLNAMLLMSVPFYISMLVVLNVWLWQKVV